MPDRRDLLVTLADARFLDQAKQLFSGAFHAGRWQGDFLLLAVNVPESERTWFEERGIMVYHVEPIYPEDVWRSWSLAHPPVVASKFHLFTPFFKRWRTIVYLDADIIVRGDLSPLTDVDRFSAVQDFARTLSSQIKPLKASMLKGYNLAAPAFNTGVFAFPSDLITEATFDELVRIGRQYIPCSRYADQLALNLMFSGQWHALDSGWNSFVYEFPGNVLFVRSLMASLATLLYPPGAILHFPAGLKPWDGESSYYAEWKESLRQAQNIRGRVVSGAAHGN